MSTSEYDNLSSFLYFLPSAALAGFISNWSCEFLIGIRECEMECVMASLVYILT